LPATAFRRPAPKKNVGHGTCASARSALSQITVDDEPLDGALKTQRKPLELLKYTVAMGGA
jgi:hypothetical protein